MWVKIICSDEKVAFEGEWEREPAGDAEQQDVGAPRSAGLKAIKEEVLEYARGEAVRRDMPVQVELFGLGVWCITPDGRVMPGALFHEKKARGQRK